MEKPKIIAVPIRIDICRPAFFKLNGEPTYRTDKFGQEIKIDPRTGKPTKPRWSVTLLLDPTNVKAKANIDAVKAEAARQLDLRFDGRANWPKADPRTGMGAPILCFGNGNDLKKVYDGFKDQWYIKCSDTERPLLGSLDGREVRLLSDGWHVCDKDHNPTEEKIDQTNCPYAGCNARARVSLWTYNNESCGVNANIISLQFTGKNDSFGGRPSANANDEFEKMAGDAAAQQASAPDPFG